MAMFVHLAFESSSASIRRSGISRPRKQTSDHPGGVYAVPVTRNFYLSHQWLRELKRRNGGQIVAVYIRVPDDERVWVGRYNQEHTWMTAAEAVAAFMACESREGWEVVIPRRIKRSEIHRFRAMPQVIGWRYFPGSHGRKPCGCSYCQRGEYKGASIRKRLGNDDQ